MTPMADRNSTLDFLRKLCSAREYCRTDIKTKAEARLDDKDEVEKILTVLESEGYLDEERYARAFARDKAALAGWGVIKIRYMLNAKGIAKDITDRAIREIDSEKAEERLRRTLDTKYRTLKEDPQAKLKLLKFALSRGYDYDTANRAVKETMQK